MTSPCIITALLQQATITNILMESIGLYYPVLLLSTIFANMPMAFLPILLLLNGNADILSLIGMLSVFYLHCTSGWRAPCFWFPLHIATIRIVQAVAPIVAGCIVTSLSGRPWLIWIIIGLIGLVAATSTSLLRKATKSKT